MKRLVFIVVILSALISLDSYSQSGYVHISYSWGTSPEAYIVYPDSIVEQMFFECQLCNGTLSSGGVYVKNIVYNKMYEEGYEPVTLGQTWSITDHYHTQEVWFKP